MHVFDMMLSHIRNDARAQGSMSPCAAGAQEVVAQRTLFVHRPAASVEGACSQAMLKRTPRDNEKQKVVRRGGDAEAQELVPILCCGEGQGVRSPHRKRNRECGDVSTVSTDHMRMTAERNKNQDWKTEDHQPSSTVAGRSEESGHMCFLKKATFHRAVKKGTEIWNLGSERGNESSNREPQES